MQANPGIQRRCARRFGDLAPKQGTHCPAAGSTNCDPPDVWPQFGVSGGLWRPGPQAKQDAPLRLGCISDRKSVVSGQSVSVRVDLGGRRLIKKKNVINKK